MKQNTTNKQKQARALLNLGLTPDTPVTEALKTVEEAIKDARASIEVAKHNIAIFQDLQSSLKAAQQKAAKPAQAKPKRRDFPAIRPLSATTRLIQFLESTLPPVEVPSKFTSLADLKAQRGLL